MNRAPDGGETFEFANPHYEGHHQPVAPETPFSYRERLHEQRRLGLEGPAIINGWDSNGDAVRLFRHVLPDGSVVTTDSPIRPEVQEVRA